MIAAERGGAGSPDARWERMVRGARSEKNESRHQGDHLQPFCFVRQAAKNAGCHGNVSKARAADDLVNAIRAVLAGNTFFRSED
jgi:hypothetical protein